MLRTLPMMATGDGDFSGLGRVVQDQTESRIFLRNHPGTLAYLLSARWNARGPVTTVHTACASSGQSLGQALLQIQRGEADVILAGGADSLAGELLLAGFCLLGALSRRNDAPEKASRPFDRDRDGFVASEGAAMLVLEERGRALKSMQKFLASAKPKAPFASLICRQTAGAQSRPCSRPSPWPDSRRTMSDTSMPMELPLRSTTVWNAWLYSVFLVSSARTFVFHPPSQQRGI